MGTSRTPTPQPVPRTGEFSPVPSRQAKPLIFIVDDDWDTGEAFAEALDENGFVTVCLPNGQAGLEELERQPTPAAIILDLLMPVMDGWTFFDRVRALPHLADIPIIVITAVGPHWGYPVAHVLPKPVGRNELVAAVRSVVRSRLVKVCSP
jgi:two-component system, response regulator, stage 0 sporulation protein F